MTKTINKERIVSGLIGFAIGDAIGVPIEFTSRDSRKLKPVKEMYGYGTYSVPAGTWSDDTSMTIATMSSIVEKGKIDYKDIMDKFCSWFQNAEYTATDRVFDIGIGTREALNIYMNNNVEPIEAGGTNIKNNGNGSLMRMLPIAQYLYTQDFSDEEKNTIINNTSSLTHGHELSKMGCHIYCDYMDQILQGKSLFEAYFALGNIDYSKYYSDETISAYSRILNNELDSLSENEISSSGYIVSTLEACLWVALNTNNYEDAIIKAINLGNDTDTIGSITGSIVGTYYGINNIPKKWSDVLIRKAQLEQLASNFSKKINENNKEKSGHFDDEMPMNFDKELYNILTNPNYEEAIDNYNFIK